MAEPFLRFKRDDESNYPAWVEELLSSLFVKVKDKNKDGKITNVITNSAKYGLIAQTDFFDKDIAQEGKTDTYYIIRHGDFVYNPRSSQEAPCGPIKTYELQSTGIVSPLYKVFTAIGNVVTSYWKYYFETTYWNPYIIKVGGKGARHDRFSVKDNDFFAMPVVRPSSNEEQNKIAGFLTDVDTQIENYQQSLDNLEEQRKELLRQVFSQELRFKKDDGSTYPDWQEDCISSFGKCIAGATPSTKNPAYWEKGTIPWLSSGEVNKGQIFDTDKKITKLGYENSSTKMVKANSVIIAMAGQGKTRGTVGITRIPLCTNQSLCSIETDDTISSDYLYQHLKTRYMDLRNLSSGDGVRGGLNLSIIRSFVIQYPPSLEEQQKIADFFSELDERIELERQRLQTMQDLKKGLLQQMFC